MKVCFDCRDKYFSEWSEVSSANLCEVCGQETEVCEVTVAGLKSGLLLYKVVQTSENPIPVFVKNCKLRTSKDKEKPATTVSHSARKMTAFGKA